MEFEIQRCTRHCAGTGRELLPGETFYSALVEKGSSVERLDYSEEAWTEPPENAIGWWKTQLPDPKVQRKQWAPNDVMLRLFDELAEQPEQQDVRYVLALLLVRRRVMRMEEAEPDEQAGEDTLVLYCPRRDETYRVPVVLPDAERAEEIQRQIAQLLE
ncbi:MAG: hypothetical protein ACOCWL_02655 [Thermoguttaceae bacterium]